MEALLGVEPRHTVLQTVTLPFGYSAITKHSFAETVYIGFIFAIWMYHRLQKAEHVYPLISKFKGLFPPDDAPSCINRMLLERMTRLELATPTLARWCSAE